MWDVLDRKTGGVIAERIESSSLGRRETWEVYYNRVTGEVVY